ncbi:MAG: ShlB/FhaC/HecB family hemolysin secretion/activation protein [Spirulina sp.]
MCRLLPKRRANPLFAFAFLCLTTGMSLEVKAEEFSREEEPTIEIPIITEKQAECIRDRQPKQFEFSECDRVLQAQIDRPALPSRESLPEENIPLPPPSDLLNPQPSTPEIPFDADTPGTIIANRFEVRGSTIFSPEELAELTKDYLNRAIAFRELLEVRSAITDAYYELGYETTGALIPPQEITDGIIIIEVIEGEIEAINVMGTRRLNPEYIRSRLGLVVQKPLNVDRLREGLQLLQRDPLIASLSSELSAGTGMGKNILDVTVEEAKTFNYSVLLNNNRAPIVGSFRRGIGAIEANVWGWGDRFSLLYNNTDGSNSLDVSYSVPYSPKNGIIRYSYGNNSSRIINNDFSIFQIQSDSEYHELYLRQPLRQTPAEELAMGLIYSYQSSQSRIGLFDIPLASRGADINGNTRVSALRFFQEWIKRSSSEVFSARSQFSLGTNWFNPTDNDTLPDSTFFSWRGQVQWIKRIDPDILFILRGDLQLSDRSLLSLEQFSLGGQTSVRGYRQDLIFADNGFLASAEVRIPVLRTVDGVLQVAPFVDLGMAWNHDNIAIEPNALTSVGVGLRWQQSNSLTIRLDWGIPLTEVNTPRPTLQENGIYFSILYNLFP